MDEFMEEEEYKRILQELGEPLPEEKDIVPLKESLSEESAYEEIPSIQRSAPSSELYVQEKAAPQEVELPRGELAQRIIERVSTPARVKEEYSPPSKRVMEKIPDRFEPKTSKIATDIIPLLKGSGKTVEKIKEKLNNPKYRNHVNEYLENKNSLGKTLLRVLTGAAAGGSGRGVGEIVNAMRIQDSAGMAEAQMLNLNDPSSEISNHFRSVARGIDQENIMQIPDNATAAQLLEAMPWLKNYTEYGFKDREQERKRLSLMLEAQKAMEAEQGKKFDQLRALEQLDSEDKWKRADQGIKSDRLGLDYTKAEIDALYKGGMLDHKGAELESIDEYRKGQLDLGKEGLGIKDFSAKDLAEYRRLKLQQDKDKYLSQNAAKIKAANMRSARGGSGLSNSRKLKPLGEVEQRSISDLTMTMKMADNLINKFNDPEYKVFVGRINASMQDALALANSEDPRAASLKTELKDFAKQYMASVEGGRPSDYDAVSYEAMIGKLYDQPGSLVEKLQYFRNKARETRAVKLEMASRNRKDISGFKDLIGEEGRQTKKNSSPRGSKGMMIIKFPDGSQEKFPSSEVESIKKQFPGAKVVK